MEVVRYQFILARILTENVAVSTHSQNQSEYHKCKKAVGY
jgi:hypothetical protein